VFDHPQVQARNMQFEVDHPLSGRVPLVANPIKMSITPPQHSHAPPLLGQQTAEILQTCLGLSAEQLGALKKDGVIGG
jgi:crotonobetainyl-CoA:carnitine CoA-transferase CaiB-like acyl-CoA transferase